MKKNTQNQTRKILPGLFALLLAAIPQANAAKTHKKAAKASSPADAMEKGTAELEAKKFDAAIASFAKAAKEDRKDASAFFMLGYAHFQRGFAAGNPESADKNDALETIRAYATAQTLDPNLTTVAAPYRFYHSLALSYEATESYDKALDAYRKAYESAPHNPMLPLYAARMRYRLGDMSKAANNLSLSLKIAREQDKVDAVLNYMKKDPNFAPMLQSPLSQKVLASYAPASSPMIAKARRSMTPEADMRDAIRDTPTDSRRQMALEPAQDPTVLKQLSVADGDFRALAYRGAIDNYNETLRLNQKVGTLNVTQLSLIYERIGTSYNKLGVTNGAIKALRYAVQEMPFNSAAHYQMALAYSVSGHFNESLHSLGEALKSAPSSGELKKYMLLAKTDSELDPLRDMPGFSTLMSPYAERLQARR